MAVTRDVLRPGFGLGWIAANTAGYALAFAVWEGVSQPIWPALSGFLGGSLTLALYGATLGVGVSVAQALVLRLRGDRAGLWIAATTVGFALGFAVAGWVALVVSQNSVTNLITDTATSASNRLVGVLVREFAVNIPFDSGDRRKCRGGALADAARGERSGRPLDPRQRCRVHARLWHGGGAHPTHAHPAGGDLWGVVRRMHRRDHGAHRVALVPTGGGVGSGYVSVRTV